MAFAMPVVPLGFRDLNTLLVEGLFNANVNLIGVVVDYLPAAQSKGTDLTMRFTLHDQSWIQGIGLPVRFFNKLESQLPKIQNSGDVVLLRNVKLINFHNTPSVLSNSSSSWVVLESASLQASSDPQGADVVMHQSGTGNYLAARPDRAELLYAQQLLTAEDPTTWQQPAKPTSLQIAGIQQAAGGTPSSMPDKFRVIEDLKVPTHKNDKIFVDLFGEVRRVFYPDHDPPRAELSLTDYTELQYLYNYVPQQESDGEPEPFDGDRFRYIEGTHKAWPGPWGKMTMLVILWQPHRDHAVKNVEPGSFVSLKNVQIVLDREGAKLEGHCRTDRFYQTKVNVEVCKVCNAHQDERFKSLLQRKKAYEQHCKEKSLRFKRDPKMKEPDVKQIDAVQGHADSAVTGKAKRNRENKQRRRKHKTNQAKANDNETEDEEVQHGEEAAFPEPKEPTANTHVRINNYDVKPLRITTILDPEILRHKTPAGNGYFLPFQNCKYKLSHVRVIDYFPTNLEDFCAPVRESQYAALKQDGEDSESDIDTPMTDADASRLCSRSTGEGGVRWQWRFIILIEDARPQPNTAAEHPELTQMEVIVSDTDADYLLRDIQACDLRRNPNTLARLREKLFVLWGDLQERKDEGRKLQGEEMEGVVGGEVKVSARPFECLIKEYGVWTEGGGRCERMFRLWGTSI